ncbi:hypothetical protein BKA62DRAFT_675272 [Auriculariales sp. MPI-PUGE-AT-0066]|nr:hypothetical protein BKA62DRAFT_675272 [Auriculariales sp. MPI-PUGE-AT-0066]
MPGSQHCSEIAQTALAAFSESIRSNTASLVGSTPAKIVAITEQLRIGAEDEIRSLACSLQASAPDLPDEIWYAVYNQLDVAAVPSHTFRPVSSEYDVQMLAKARQHDVLSVARVSRRWRARAIGEPALWTHFSFDASRTSPRLLELFIKRSAQNLFHFELQDAAGNFSLSSRLCKLFDEVSAITNIRSFKCQSAFEGSPTLEILVSKFNHLQKLEYDGYLTENALSVIPKCLNVLILSKEAEDGMLLKTLRAFPSLHTLDIKLRAIRPPFSPHDEANNQGLRVMLPRLVNLTIRVCALDGGSTAWGDHYTTMNPLAFKNTCCDIFSALSRRFQRLVVHAVVYAELYMEPIPDTWDLTPIGNTLKRMLELFVQSTEVCELALSILIEDHNEERFFRVSLSAPNGWERVFVIPDLVMLLHDEVPTASGTQRTLEFWQSLWAAFPTSLRVPRITAPAEYVASLLMTGGFAWCAQILDLTIIFGPESRDGDTAEHIHRLPILPALETLRLQSANGRHSEPNVAAAVAYAVAPRDGLRALHLASFGLKISSSDDYSSLRTLARQVYGIPNARPSWRSLGVPLDGAGETVRMR